MKLCVIVGLVLAATVSYGTCSRENRRGIENLSKEPPLPPMSFGASARSAQLLTLNQKVDQFNASDYATYQMRYYANGEHYVPGGPIFIYIGGEWTISAGWVLGGHMYDMAKEMGGYIFYPEHRYYGSSLPTPDASSDNLRYLDVDQSLADLAYFVDYQRATLEGASNSGVIVVGASYAATMAVWFRQRYPGKANGAWASSDPLLAQLDFTEYMQVVSWAMGDVGGAACKNRVQEAFTQVEAAIASRNVALLSSTFNLCEDVLIDSELDVWNFVSTLGWEFAGLVQYHWSGDIEYVCGVMTNAAHSDALSALGAWIKQMYGSYCVDARYQSFIDYYRETSWTSTATLSAMRQWLFQTCNEFGWYQTAEDGSTIFGTKMALKLSTEMCRDLYGSQFDSVFTQYRIDRTNRNHNGMNPTVTNVFFTHGGLDPWRPMGVQTDVNSDSPVVILEGYSHCADLNSISDSDSQQMRETKERVTLKIRQWLSL